jgi:hypothetical protein
MALLCAIEIINRVSLALLRHTSSGGGTARGKPFLASVPVKTGIESS